jgi:hypothetical protein
MSSSKKHIVPVVKIVINESCEFCCPNIKHMGDDTYCSVTNTDFGEGAPYPYKMYPYQKECPYLKDAREKEIKKFCDIHNR